MERIITHGGKSHIDEMIAIGILLYFECSEPSFPEIERRDPSYEELEDPEVAVVDIGGRHEPENYNFDHHHDESLPASFRLVAQAYEVEAGNVDQLMAGAHSWYEYKDVLDRKGPNRAAHSVDVHGDTGPLHSPVESWVVHQFREQDAPEWSLAMMNMMAHDWIERAVEFSGVLEKFRTEGHVEKMMDLGVYVIDEEPDASVIDRLRKAEDFPDFDVTISKNPREEGGWTAFRYDDVDLDFQEAAFKAFAPDEVQFAHNTGFLAVMPEKDQTREVIREAGTLSDAYKIPA